MVIGGPDPRQLETILTNFSHILVIFYPFQNGDGAYHFKMVCGLIPFLVILKWCAAGHHFIQFHHYLIII